MSTADDGKRGGRRPGGASLPDGGLLDLALARARVDRAAALRADDATVTRALAEGGTRVLLLTPERTAPFVPGDPPRLVLRPPSQGDAEREVWFLGVLDGTAYLAVVGGDDGERHRTLPDLEWAGLRQVGADLDDTDAGLLTTATALAEWHRRNLRCPRCGAVTEVVQGGWLRRCPADGSEHHPRTDPAVIMAVTDPHDRLLLGSGVGWPDDRVSVLAGFVEAGESLEAAVAREVAEEVGVQVGDVVYRGNQPWPFPASLMVGFRARARTTDISVEQAELSWADWFTREELQDAVRSGRLTLPSRLSIASRLVEEWFGGPLPRARARR